MPPVLLAFGGTALGTAVAAGAAASSGDHTAEIIAAACGGLAAMTSAITGLVVALRNREQVIVVSPSEAEDMGLDVPQPKRRRRAS